MRRHGWQRPLQPLQVVGMFIYGFLVASFYRFLGLFLGTRTAVIVVTSIFSFTTLAVMFLFIRFTAIDSSDKTNIKRKNKKSMLNSQLNYGFLLGHTERKILRKSFEYHSSNVASAFFHLAHYKMSFHFVSSVILRLKNKASTAGPAIVVLKGLITIIVVLKGLITIAGG